MNIFLTGYRGTGKSTVASRIAGQLGWDWLDTDDQVELRAGCSIAELFAAEGEDRFRQLEHDVIVEACAAQEQVVALGGGAVIAARNREALCGHGPIIWLRAELDTIVDRLAADKQSQSRRPDLTSQGGREEIRELLQSRHAVYQAASDFEIATDKKSPGQVADEAVFWFEGSRS